MVLSIIFHLFFLLLHEVTLVFILWAFWLGVSWGLLHVFPPHLFLQLSDPLLLFLLQGLEVLFNKYLWLIRFLFIFLCVSILNLFHTSSTTSFNISFPSAVSLNELLLFFSNSALVAPSIWANLQWRLTACLQMPFSVLYHDMFAANSALLSPRAACVFVLEVLIISNESLAVLA